MSAMAFEPSARVCIVGGGLQGCAAAFYLKKRGFSDITVVERTGVAAAASGKGGGFLARGWGSGPTKALHERSFDLHRDLALELSLSSYRAISTLEVSGEQGLRQWPPASKATKKPQADGPAWLDATDTKAKLMDPHTAQVVPAELCAKLFEHSGAKLVQQAARGLQTKRSPGGPLEVTGVLTDAGVVEADVFVVAMGAWSVLLEDWLGAETGLRVPLEGVLSSSIVYEGTPAVAAEPFALFCAEDSNSCHLECYPRVDGSVYICGIGGSDYVSGPRLREGGDVQDASLMKANPKRVAAAAASFSALAPTVAAGREPVLAQACMRPCAPDALPLLGRVPGTSNCILATGHNCWGILWAPITGKIISELVADGTAAAADISAFAPDRFMERKAKRGRATADAPVGEQW